MIKVLGMDMALNHSGFVTLDDYHNILWWGYTTDKATHVKQNGTRMQIPKPENKDANQFSLWRLLWWQKIIGDVIACQEPSYVGIEDYAFSTRGMPHLKGELGGVARLAAINNGAKLRLHDPTSIKMYIAHNGLAKPETVAGAVFERWPETKKAWDGETDLVKQDLAVAYAIARMVLDEIMLRMGKLQLKDFHEKEVQVWNRTTKAYPVSILGREFLRA